MTPMPDKTTSHLYSAAISDALDSLGWRKQWMHHSIRPLSSEYAICGPAATMHIAEVKEEDTEAPYEMLIQSLDSLQPGEVVVIDCDGSENIAVWGELLSTAAGARGAVGVVMDGLCRDVARVLRMKFPAFGRGTLCTDIRGRGQVVSFREPVSCGGVRVNPGDMIFGDIDGVLAVPTDLWPEVFERASQKARTENTVRDEIRSGAFLRDVWAKHKVL